MIDQLDAFDTNPPRFRRARATDPRSSGEAAASVEKSGRAKSDALRVLNALRRYQQSTSAELARFARIDRYAVARRLPELKEAGLIDRIDPTPHIKPCDVSGKRVCRWVAR